MTKLMSQNVGLIGPGADPRIATQCRHKEVQDCHLAIQSYQELIKMAASGNGKLTTAGIGKKKNAPRAAFRRPEEDLKMAVLG
jgi:hypothetical protein